MNITRPVFYLDNNCFNKTSTGWQFIYLGKIIATLFQGQQINDKVKYNFQLIEDILRYHKRCFDAPKSLQQ